MPLLEVPKLPFNVTTLFQYSIGDADTSDATLNVLDRGLSILHWRCVKRSNRGPGYYYSPLSILHWRCSGAAGDWQRHVYATLSILHWRCLLQRPAPSHLIHIPRFQYSIGDALRCICATRRRICPSILHWRCGRHNCGGQP